MWKKEQKEEKPQFSREGVCFGFSEQTADFGGMDEGRPS